MDLLLQAAAQPSNAAVPLSVDHALARAADGLQTTTTPMVTTPGVVLCAREPRDTPAFAGYQQPPHQPTRHNNNFPHRKRRNSEHRVCAPPTQGTSSGQPIPLNGDPLVLGHTRTDAASTLSLLSRSAPSVVRRPTRETKYARSLSSVSSDVTAMRLAPHSFSPSAVAARVAPTRLPEQSDAFALAGPRPKKSVRAGDEASSSSSSCKENEALRRVRQTASPSDDDNHLWHRRETTRGPSSYPNSDKMSATSRLATFASNDTKAAKGADEDEEDEEEEEEDPRSARASSEEEFEDTLRTTPSPSHKSGSATIGGGGAMCGSAPSSSSSSSKSKSFAERLADDAAAKHMRGQQQHQMMTAHHHNNDEHDPPLESRRSRLVDGVPQPLSLDAPAHPLLYEDLINYPRSRGKAHARRCVMCGRLATGEGATCAIPLQNKDVCKRCDTGIWRHAATGEFFKWCKGCKKFLHVCAFAEKLAKCTTKYSKQPSKCDRCRERGRQSYMSKRLESSSSNSCANTSHSNHASFGLAASSSSSSSPGGGQQHQQQHRSALSSSSSNTNEPRSSSNGGSSTSDDDDKDARVPSGNLDHIQEEESPPDGRDDQSNSLGVGRRDVVAHRLLGDRDKHAGSRGAMTDFVAARAV